MIYLNILNNLNTFQTLTVTPPNRERASVGAFEKKKKKDKKLILEQFSDKCRCFWLKRSRGVCSGAQFFAVWLRVCCLLGLLAHG